MFSDPLYCASASPPQGGQWAGLKATCTQSVRLERLSVYIKQTSSFHLFPLVGGLHIVDLAQGCIKFMDSLQGHEGIK